MNQRYIAMLATDAIYGFFGTGDTEEKALAQLKKEAGRIKKADLKRIKVIRFESELPFAPADRAATEEEADAYVSKDGATNWIRCERYVQENPS